MTPSELISYAKLGWGAISGIWRFTQRNKRKLTPQQKLELRNKWKPLFSDFLREHHVKELRTDVIVRDMRRMDVYPEISRGKGISSWFRTGLCDTYERGIMVGLRWESLVKVPEGYRHADWSKQEEGIKVLLAGFVPYENIESVDWEGDDYYQYPHIYCYFTFKGEPYERIMFVERKELDGWPYHTDLVDYESVRKLSKKYGIKPR